MRQIIKQPNGKFCIFSSVVDSITHYNMNENDIIEELVAESRKEIEEQVKKVISALNNNTKPYYQFTMSYDEMLELVKQIHGNKEVKKIQKIIES